MYFRETYGGLSNRRIGSFWLRKGITVSIRIIIILVVLLSAFLLTPSYASPYSQGKASYQAGRYDDAVKHFKSVVKQHPSHSKAHFYLGLSYAKKKSYEKARQSFQKVLEIENLKKLNPNGPQPSAVMIRKAEKNLAVMTKSHMTAQGQGKKASQIVTRYATKSDNYLAHALPNGKVIHWRTDRMPLAIYIADGQHVPGWSPQMSQVVQKAAAAWSQASLNRLRFRVTSKKSEADIVVRWKQRFRHDRIGVNAFQTAGQTIIRSDIYLATIGPSGRPLSYSEMESTAIHELGHALGIQGHSPDPGDIMFFSQNPTQGKTLSQRDRKTIQLLYQQKADVTNTANISTQKTQQVFKLLAKASPLVKTQPQQALVYANKAYQLAPSHPDVQRIRTTATYNLGVAALNHGVEAGKQNNKPLARHQFKEAVQLFKSISRSQHAPEGTLENLSRARQGVAWASH